MTKKDYELIANVLHTHRPPEESNNYKAELAEFGQIVGSFSKALMNENSAFNIGKFNIACYEGKHIRKSISGRI